MEVGAVKQAFNNELILLKKKLNQAKTQIIHKLTRKAKTFTEKKAPEQLKEKLKRKAESAVSEVLIIKKIKVQDIAKFILTHKGELKQYLNKPNVDNDKACARLLLHKSMLDKYKFIRDRFASVPINDLLMSREERRKIKKEAREAQKNKKKGKKDNKAESVGDVGEWSVEDVEMPDSKAVGDDDEQSADERDITDVENESERNSDSDVEEDESADENVEKRGSPDEQSDEEINENDESATDNDENDEEDINEEEDDTEERSNENEDINVGQLVKIKPDNNTTMNKVAKSSNPKPVEIQSKQKIERKKPEKAKDTNKNKNFNEKILLRKFKKGSDDAHNEQKKIVDPFFITASGENYMSVAEQRPPDEVKEVHKEGNRKLRRAVMFGHVPKIRQKPNYRDNNQFDKRNGSDKRGFNNFNDRGDKRQSGFNKNEDFNNRKGNAYNNRNNDFNNRQNNFNKTGDRAFQNRNNDKSGDKVGFPNKNNNVEPVPEKLHPSWEAKKRQSGILPFKGKKIVFDES